MEIKHLNPPPLDPIRLGRGNLTFYVFIILEPRTQNPETYFSIPYNAAPMAPVSWGNSGTRTELPIISSAILTR